MRLGVRRTAAGLRRRRLMFAVRGRELLAQPPPDAPRPPVEGGVLFVCLGNICRSPLAEAILRERLARIDLLGRVAVASAGTTTWKEGSPPDLRARLVAARHGLRIDGLRSRSFDPEDFDLYDRIVVFDRSNEVEVLRRIRSESDRVRVERLVADAEVVDPVDGSTEEFEHAYDEIAAACDRIVGELRQALPAANAA